MYKQVYTILLINQNCCTSIWNRGLNKWCHTTASTVVSIDKGKGGFSYQVVE